MLQGIKQETKQDVNNIQQNSETEIIEEDLKDLQLFQDEPEENGDENEDSLTMPATKDEEKIENTSNT